MNKLRLVFFAITFTFFLAAMNIETFAEDEETSKDIEAFAEDEETSKDIEAFTEDEETTKDETDDVIMDEKTSGTAAAVSTAEELEEAVNNHIENIIFANDINMMHLEHPIEIYHSCNIFGDNHILYASGYKQTQLTMKGNGQTVNMYNLIYQEAGTMNLGGCIIRMYTGTVNLHECKSLGGMHGIRIDGGTANLYNFECSTPAHGVVLTGKEEKCVANLYGNTKITGMPDESTAPNRAGIDVERSNESVVNIYDPITIRGYYNGIFNVGIINCIPNGSTISAEGSGIYNTGIIGEVQGSVFGNSRDGIVNTKTINSCKALVYSNNNGIVNNGNMSITGGEIYSNNTGVDNSSTLRHTAGVIRNNRQRGVYQHGEYYISKDARVPASCDYTNISKIASEGNAIYLAKGHVIRIPAAFNSLASGSPPIAVIDSGASGSGGDRYAGREAVVVETADRTTYARTLMQYFPLKFDKTYINDSITGWYTNHWTDTATGRTQNWMRAGNGVIGRTGSLFYSLRLQAFYKNGFEGREASVDSFLTEVVNENGIAYSPIKSVPSPEAYWRGEDSTFIQLKDRIVCYITLPNEGVRSEKYSLSDSFVNTGYSCTLTAKDGNTFNGSLKGGETISGKYLMTQASFSAAWNFSVDVVYDGNEQTNESEAPDYIKRSVGFDTALDDNKGPNQDVVDSFGKPDYFRKENDAYTDRYSFAGWSYDTKGRYDDDTLIKPNGYLTAEGQIPMDYVFERLKQCKSISDINPAENAGSVGVRLYVVWDKYPEINADDRAFTSEGLKNWEITDSNLLKKITAVDKEDGSLNDSKSIRLKYDLTELEGVDADNPTKSMKVLIEATDGFGNVSCKQIIVRVFYDKSTNSKISDTQGTRSTPIYVRFIDENYYNKGLNATDDAAALEAWQSGACEPESVWYKDDKYKVTIQNAFMGLKNESYLVSYVFDKNTILEAKKYSRSTSSEWIDNAAKWQRSFYEKYLKPNQS